MNPGPASKPQATAAGMALAALLLSPELSAKRALTLEAAYTGEVWHNIRGGLDTGSRYLDNVVVAAELDAERLWGWSGTRLLADALYNNGNALSGDLVGDLQTVSNIESGLNDAHVYQALLHTGLGEHGSMRVGLYDLNSEFDVLESATLFLNSAHGIGTDIGQTGENGPSIFPVTGLGMRLAWRWNDHWTTRAAALDGVPGRRDEPEEMGVDLGGGDGALLALEAERHTSRSTVLLGAWGYSAEFATWSDGHTADGNTGAYLRGEWRARDDITLFGRLGWANGRFNTFEYFLSGGVHWRGLLPGRPHDAFGVAVAWAEASGGYRRAQRSGGAAAERREIAVELTYRMPLGDRIVLQPDVQLVLDPGLDPNLDHAFVLGLRLEVTLP